MNKFVFILLLFLGAALVILSFGELETILGTLQGGQHGYLFLALLLQLAWFLVIGRMYRSIYHLLGMDDTTLNLGIVAAATSFVNTVMPTGGMGGIALFAAEARKRGHPTGKATVAAALCMLFDQAAFLCILALGLIVLLRRGNLSLGEVGASALLLVLAVMLAFLLYLGYRSAARLGQVLALLSRQVNRATRLILRRDFLSEARAQAFAAEIGEGLSGLSGHPLALLRPVLWGLLNKSLLMGILLTAFLAFDVPFSAGTIVGGFSIGYLFLIVSPTPSGIGVVEGLMPLALSSLRVPWSQAVIVTLAYRAVTFWATLGIGALAFRRLHLNGNGEK
ncbi:MAG: lysylphosphatidylglycerol synthase transmembrane domain-containing protein [Chloroflexota bacterium]